MGLDQMMFAVTQHPDNTDFGYHDDCEYKQFGTWRKHPYLQGWMEKLFNAKADQQSFEGITEFVQGIEMIAHEVDGNKLSPEEIQKAISTESEMMKRIKLEHLASAAINVAKSRVFNRQYIRLNVGDLDQLEMAVNLGELPPTQGFFFGDDSSDHYKEYDLKIIEAAREAIKLGLDVYYDSWW